MVCSDGVNGGMGALSVWCLWREGVGCGESSAGISRVG